MAITNFSQNLAFMNKGMTDAELTEELASLVKAVRETGKAGSLTLKLKVQMMNQQAEDMITIEPVISATPPKLPGKKALFWSTCDGDLLRNDPEQIELELKTVEAPNQNQPLKKVN
ncbi:MAG: hypothetical protein CSB48_02795 [Proteobacteria bacterium]|nr:MAG: hypothetical protein CSB48_02795 [Pseudomonadota bacterium]